MSKRVDISPADEFFIGEDKSLRFYVTTGEPIEVSASAVSGDTTLSVRPLKESISANAKIRFGSHVITVSQLADVGDVTLQVSALTGSLSIGSIGKKVQDITSWTSSLIIYDSPSGTAVVTKSGTVTDADDGILDVSLAAADTASLAPGKYYYRLKRTNTGSVAVIAYGACTLLE